MCLRFRVIVSTARAATAPRTHQEADNASGSDVARCRRDRAVAARQCRFEATIARAE